VGCVHHLHRSFFWEFAIPSSHWLFHWSLVTKFTTKNLMDWATDHQSFIYSVSPPIDGHRADLDVRMLWLTISFFSYRFDDPLPIPFPALIVRRPLCFGRSWSDGCIDGVEVGVFRHLRALHEWVICIRRLACALCRVHTTIAATSTKSLLLPARRRYNNINVLPKELSYLASD